ncbi:hypothetical protein O3597_17200 [Verrucosispora sp. WMMA2044]|uniref:hypothetical protein n=1 Tax=Verrucosispora sp. WMMA2044 TaxID=3016419 RepID=UPI00248BA33D|nr:hypothetical protein [Verrucosispora sp. WMMA2044]WBB46907.1 hypothetical protein O3597_17200 [Verrucosispora sp. WMMA2044]
MSSDFGFWKHGAGDPGDIFDNIAEGVTEGLRPDPAVLRFRDDVLARWPDIGDVLEPSEHDLEENPEDVTKYVLLTLSVRQLNYIPELLAMAKAHGLVGYSGVADEPL